MKFSNSYIFIVLAEGLPNLKIQSNGIIDAASFFVKEFVLMEKDFDAKESNDSDSITITCYPNTKLIQKLKLQKKKEYTFLVIEEKLAQKIDPYFLKQFNYKN